jgi:hypothetical protein
VPIVVCPNASSTCCEKSLRFRRNIKIHKKLQRESLSGTDAAARAILLHSLPTEPRISFTPRVDDINEIQMFPNQTVLYRPIPQVQDLQANLLYPQASSNRRSFEGARLKINRK